MEEDSGREDGGGQWVGGWRRTVGGRMEEDSGREDGGGQWEGGWRKTEGNG